ncbi:MAG TPA: hypothetical protein VHF67_07580 [Gaiellaceae bacterium]|nr:hypothetical protein [Gaiellaceae bacterium]
METTTIRLRSLVKATAAALAAAALTAPAGVAAPAPFASQSDGAARDTVGYRVADGAVAQSAFAAELESTGVVRDGWDGRFDEPVATIGYRAADGHVPGRTTDAISIRDGWDGRFDEPVAMIGYRAADGHVPGRTTDAISIRDGWQGQFPESTAERNAPLVRRAIDRERPPLVYVTGKPTVVGYRTADGNVPELVSAAPVSAVADDGFDWSDAGAGAGVTLGAVLIALLAILASRQRRRLAFS